jgi:DNA-binding IclR family transcriptional regulator
MSGVQSIERAFAILRCLASGPGGVTELAERVGLPKSTTSRLLSTMEGLGVVEQVESGGRYSLGQGMVEIASAVLPGRHLVAAARPHLVELMQLTGEAVGLSVIDGREVHYLDQVNSESQIQVHDWTGERLPCHATSSGLVLLAYSSPEVIADYLMGPLVRFTNRTITDPGRLAERLEAVRRDGYAWIFEEFTDGANSVAAPVRGRTGDVIAAVHAHGPAFRYPGDRDPAAIAALVVQAAHRTAAAHDAV